MEIEPVDDAVITSGGGYVVQEQTLRLSCRGRFERSLVDIGRLIDEGLQLGLIHLLSGRAREGEHA